MPIARIILDYITALVWPVVTAFGIWYYREAITTLLPGAKVILPILGSSIEATVPQLQQVVMENVGDDQPSKEQVKLLRSLRSNGRLPFDRSDESQKTARPLRNAGLLKSYPKENQLADADSIEITSLGKLFLSALDKEKKPLQVR